jgi:type I restriction enzyme S subunit
MMVSKLKDIAKVISGYPFKSSDFISGDGIPAIKIKNIKNGDIDLSECDFVDSKFLTLNEKYQLKRNDILVSLTGSHLTQPNSVVGRIALYRHSFTALLNQRAGKIIPDIKLVDPLYLYAFLSQDSIKETIAKKARGAANQANISPGDVEDTEINLPPLPTQRRIASILSAYDDLIENNHKRIKLLEELAQRTYEEWFVKFRVNGEQLPIDEKTGLPVGWERLRLQNCINNFDNKRKPLAKLVREERRGIFPYYGAADIIDYVDDYIFDGRYLLIGEDGTVITPRGVAMLQFIEGKFWVSNHAHVITGKGKISTEFIYCFLNQYPISQHITGAAQPKISQMNLNRIEIIIGTDSTMEEFNMIIQPTLNQIFNIRYQNQKLKESRDILLPKLMNGTINVE